MQFRYVDAHCHLQFDDYATDRAALIEQMRGEGVAGIVVGVDLESSQKAVELAERYEHLYASVGLHPNNAEVERYDISYLSELASKAKVVAIGECGLDYYRVLTNGTAYSALATKAKQKELFKQHIALAAELDKPLIIHCRPSKGTMDAYQELIGILKEAKTDYPDLCGDVHFFVGGVAEANALIGLGFSVSFTAVITFARDYDGVIRVVPLSSILSETDAPYVAPSSRRGQRNDPLAIAVVVAKLAEIRGENPEVVRVALHANAKRLFALP